MTGKSSKLQAGRNQAALVALLLCAVLLALRPIDDADIFWQVRIGQLITEHGFDLAESISYTNVDAPMAWLGWLGQWSLAQVHGLAGWEGVQAVHVLFYTSALAMVWFRISRCLVGPLTGALTILLVFMPCMSNCSERPQTFSFFAFALLLFLIDSKITLAKYAAAVIPLLLIWQNVHPSVALAAAVLFLKSAGCWADERWGSATTRLAWRRPLWTACLAGVAVFCTPTGLGILRVSARNAEMSRWLGIGEWLPAYAMLPATASFWFVLGLLLILWGRTRARLPWADLLPLALLTLAAVYWTRMIVFWAIIVGPTLAHLLERAGRDVFGVHFLPSINGKVRHLYRPLGIVLAIGLVASSPWVRPHMKWLPESQRRLFDAHFPIEGVAHLDRVLDAGRVYNYREWAGLLSLAGASRWRLAIDGRIYRYDRAEWQAYAEVAQGMEHSEDILAEHHPEALFLRPGYDRALIERLRANPVWESVYSDKNCHIWLPVSLNALNDNGPEDSMPTPGTLANLRKASSSSELIDQP